MDAARVLEESGNAWFWLDGEAAAPGERRVSYLGIASEVREAERGRERDFLASLRAQQQGAAAARPPRVSSGLAAGWIAALGYEFGVALVGADAPVDDAAPAFALRADAVLVVNHDTGSAEVCGDAAAAARLSALLTTRSAPVATTPARAARLHPAHELAQPVWRGDDYEARVADCRAAIRAGDAYVLCLTDTAEAHTVASPLELYGRLRQGAMRGGVISMPGRALVSASPERFLSVRGHTVSTHPIKGTRPRGESADRDRELAAELAADPKERAENLMIVDLMRNDLARVCAVGSVRVERFLTVETHPRVHQLVSTVAGELRAGADVYDALEACFPGGSMTGAPKRSAIEVLSFLEAGPRGLYAGCFGWIDDGGDAELAMTIRGVELRAAAGTVWPADTATRSRALVGAGGGITIDSVPEAERRERDLKAAAMLANL